MAEETTPVLLPGGLPELPELPDLPEEVDEDIVKPGAA